MAERSTPTTDRGWQAHLSNIRAPEKRTWIPMRNGLTVCLEPSGAKTFQASIRRRGDVNASRIRIGSFPACTVADARRRLIQLRALAREGRDPSIEARRARAGVVALRTLGDPIAQYLRPRDGDVAAKTHQIERELLSGVLDPALGDRLLADLAPVDFGAAVADYAARLKRKGRSNGTNANKLLAACRRIFKMARGWGLVDLADPTAGLSKPAKEAPRIRLMETSSSASTRG
jgi:Arm DNA-binding domain